MSSLSKRDVTDQELREITEKCVRCMYCIEDEATHMPSCPSTAYFPTLSYRPFGRLELARNLMAASGSSGEQGALAMNRGELAKRIFACTLCGNCELQCDTLTGKRILEVFKKTRRDLVGQDGTTIAPHAALLRNVMERGNPQGVDNKKKLDRLTKVLGDSSCVTKDASLLYFRGCVPSLSENLPSLVGNMTKVLVKTSTKFKAFGTVGLPDEPCCGHVLINTGQENLAMEYFDRVYQTVKSTGAKQVLFTCPACYRAFKYEYPRLLDVKPSFSCITASEFIDGLINSGKMRLKVANRKEVAGVVTYHDPCHLGRHSGIYEAPRVILKGIWGTKFVEMPRHRENSWCCGVGGGVKTGFPDFSAYTGEERINEALSIGASTLVTACPACESGFKDVLKSRQQGSNLNIIDIVDLVAQNLF